VSEYYTWVDERGDLNVFVPDMDLRFEADLPIGPHPFEARCYLEGHRSVTAESCWCDVGPEYPIHRPDFAAEPPR
jgi:hypothetical protein